MLLSLGTRGTQTSCPSPASSEMKGAPCWARVPRVPEELAPSETLQSSRLFPALPPVSHFLINIFTLHHPESLLSPHIPTFHPHDTYLSCPVSRTESRPCPCCPARGLAPSRSLFLRARLQFSHMHGPSSPAPPSVLSCHSLGHLRVILPRVKPHPRWAPPVPWFPSPGAWACVRAAHPEQGPAHSTVTSLHIRFSLAPEPHLEVKHSTYSMGRVTYCKADRALPSSAQQGQQ